jgi:WD40-like Beta Propeller Repeat
LLFEFWDLHAQDSNEIFGKNRVQTQAVNWSVYISDNFEIYYYEGGQKHAKFATKLAESQFENISDLVGFTPYTRIRLFIYNSKSDLRQSNIDYHIQYYKAGGETSFVTHSVEIPFPGTNEDFIQELKYGIAKTLINEMMYGGSFKDVIQSSYLLSLPEWFVEGAAEYVARGWSIEMDDHVRDLFATGKVKTLRGLTGRDARFLGQSIWNYVGVQYGKNNIGSILNLTRILRNPENSITNTLGIPFQAFYREWKEYYYSMAAQVIENSDMPNDETRLIKKNKKDFRFNHVKFSPDGNFLVYSQNRSGKVEVILVDLITQKRKKIYSSGYIFNEDKVDFTLPILAWQNSDNLNLIDVQNNKFRRWTYKISENKMLKSRAFRFSNIHDISFNKNGTKMAISAENFGRVDIYVMTVRSGNIKRVTNDQFDDINPRFMPGTNKLVFSSNRTTDSLRIKPGNKSSLSDNFNLYLFDPAASTRRVEKLTNNYFQNHLPYPLNENEILFLSDLNGILNLYLLDRNERVQRQLTDYQQNIRYFDAEPGTGQWAFRIMNGGSELIYLQNLPDLSHSIAEHETFRNTWIVEGKKYGLNDDSRSQHNLIQLNKTLKREPEAVDPEDINFDDLIFESEKKEKSLADIAKKDSEIDILQKLERNEEAAIQILGPYEGQNRLRAENIITALVCDNLRGLGGVLEYGLSDMFGNHKFKLGATIFFDLKSNDLYAEYRYLKNRFDYGFKYSRKTIFYPISEQSSIFHNYSMNQGEFTVSLPITEAFRISMTPFYSNTKYENISLIPVSDFTTNYLGYNFEMVFDNSSETGINMNQGTRVKIGFKEYKGVQASHKNFGNFSIDLRNYFPIYRQLVLATRFSFGKFFGKAPKNYLLGGMDNWFITSERVAQGPLEEMDLNGALFNNEDLLFMEFATALRGFPLNYAFGENFGLINVELRFPIFQFLSTKPISSSFFRNLQLVGFTDVGSSWTGRSPLSNENSFNTEVIDATGFQIKTRNYTSPYLIGYGFGLRSTMFGYYVKFDVGWGIENYQVREDQMYYITLGYDF